ncbi:hypothetical protein MPL3356_60587 [Mesorhizobium plurifarium]|uniref:Uncharacterized protein n=1 Tax=Mesorhizobium plurifarium TaxID=69974 RepID=A0A090EFF7_MESPL|nr:hypothetical protein MPL3356_60587 [Mesorhizobium plurifarium]
MKIGALDIATTTGAAVMDDDGVITTQTFKGPTRKRNILEDEKALDAEHEAKIGRLFEDFVRVWLMDSRVEMVAIEAPLPSNTSSTWAGKSLIKTTEKGASLSAVYRIYGMSMIACAMCARFNIPVRFIHQATWRKDFLGNGRPSDAKKESKAMCARLGISISSADAAEAAGIVWTLNKQINPYTPAANGLFKLPPTVRDNVG